jgi:NAD(P)-dependent dehydrogenase (short-subunit alcohol dehydrogenase family)
MAVHPEVEGLRILVTGATSGIGLETARLLARSGAVLRVHGRDPGRVSALVRELGGSAKGYIVDLSSLADASRLAEEVAVAGPLEALVNNAGIGFGADPSRREESADGFELRFAVNYLAPFVLTEALLRHQVPSKATVNVASAGQEPLDLGDLGFRRG